MYYIRLIRPHQWLKGVFCFAGVAFGQYYQLSYLILASLGFVAFCMASSSVYVLNDIFDVKSDRAHPKKSDRPIAANKISIKQAVVLWLCLLTGAIITAYQISNWAVCLILIYIVFNILYSWRLKHVVIIDVFLISFGFLLRLLIGTSGIGIPNSQWIILCTLMVTLFFGFAKRRAELLMCENNNLDINERRRVLDDYEPKMLDIFIAIFAACSIISYSLFIVLSSKPPKLIYTIVFVTYGIMYYIFKLYKHNSGQDTARDFKDFHLIGTIILWLACYLYFLNFG